MECDRTNVKLREVYESHIAAGADLRSPSGAAYKAKAALDAVNRVCGNSSSTAALAVLAPPPPAIRAAGNVAAATSSVAQLS